MKKIILVLFFAISAIGISQNKLIVSENKSGNEILFENKQIVKVATISRKSLEGELKITSNNSISINDVIVELTDINSIKLIQKSSVTFKKVLLGAGLTAIATSGVLAATSNESAVAVFAGGAATTIIGGLIKNKNINYTSSKNTFTIQ